MVDSIWITRHGNRQDFVNPDWLKTAKWKHEPGLSPDGVMQAKELALRLKNEKISHIFSSPFLRTLETANQIAKLLRLGIKVETGMGEWLEEASFKPAPVLIPMSEKLKMFPAIDPSYQPFVHPVFPETWDEMKRRVAKTLKHIIAEFSGIILLVGHGGSVDAACHALVGPEAQFQSSLCCLIKVVRSGGQWSFEHNGLNSDSIAK